MGSTATAPTETATPFDTALDAALGEETSSTESTEETSTEETGELSLDADETAAEETDEGGEKQPDAESAAAEVEKEELDLESDEKEEGEESKEEAESDELEEELDQDEEIKPDSEDEKNLYFKKTKAHRLMEAHADMKSIREEIPGANVQMLKEHYENHVTHNRMLEDFDAGFDGMGRVLGYLLGNPERPESVQAINSGSANVFAASLPVHLARTHPKALATMENVMYDALVRDLYRQAEAMEKSGTTGDELTQAKALAEVLDKKLFNKVRGQAAHQTGGPSEREQQLERDNAELRKGEESRQQQNARQRAESISQDIKAADNEVIDQWIEKVKGKGAKFSETEERHTRRDLQEAIEAAVKSNTAWRRQFGTQRDAATRKFSEESRDHLKAQRRQFVETHVRRNLRKVIGDNTRAAMTASTRSHDRQKTTQKRRQAPPSGERTSRKINVGKAMREGKLTYDELINKI